MQNYAILCKIIQKMQKYATKNKNKQNPKKKSKLSKQIFFS